MDGTADELHSNKDFFIWEIIRSSEKCSAQITECLVGVQFFLLVLQPTIQHLSGITTAININENS